MTFFLKKKTELKLQIQVLNGEFVFYVSKFIYLKSYNYQLFIADYVELDQRMKLLQISEIQASYLIIHNCSFHNIIHPSVAKNISPKNISPNNFIFQNSHSKLGPTKNSQVVSEIISEDKCINML